MRLLLRILNLPQKLRRVIRRKLILSEIRTVGQRFCFDPNDRYVVSHLTVGDDVFIAQGAHVISGEDGDIELHNGVMIGPNVTILCGDHQFLVMGKRTRDITAHGKRGRIVLEEDVWCGANVTILPGVSIGDGCIVGARAVVTRDLPSYTIAVGVPARVVRSRRTSENAP